MLDVASIPRELWESNDALAARIEDAALAVAQPAQQAFYDGWLLRYSPGKAKRARSINSIGAGMLPIADKIAHCRNFYAQRRMSCLFRITPFTQPRELDVQLGAAGFIALQDTRVMKLDLSKIAHDAASPPSVRSIDVGQFADAFGTLHELDDAKTAAERDRFARSAISAFYVAQFDGDAPIACGLVAVDGTLAGVFGMVTASAHRGRGIATSLVASLLTRARNAGAQTAYLQVEAANTPARRAYSKFGFEDCYAYWYREMA